MGVSAGSGRASPLVDVPLSSLARLAGASSASLIPRGEVLPEGEVTTEKMRLEDTKKLGLNKVLT